MCKSRVVTIYTRGRKRKFSLSSFSGLCWNSLFSEKFKVRRRLVVGSDDCAAALKSFIWASPICRSPSAFQWDSDQERLYTLDLALSSSSSSFTLPFNEQAWSLVKSKRRYAESQVRCVWIWLTGPITNPQIWSCKCCPMTVGTMLLHEIATHWPAPSARCPAWEYNARNWRSGWARKYHIKQFRSPPPIWGQIWPDGAY